MWEQRFDKELSRADFFYFLFYSYHNSLSVGQDFLVYSRKCCFPETLASLRSLWSNPLSCSVSIQALSLDSVCVTQSISSYKPLGISTYLTGFTLPCFWHQKNFLPYQFSLAIQKCVFKDLYRFFLSVQYQENVNIQLAIMLNTKINYFPVLLH